MANRTWPVSEPRGWQHTSEFFQRYPTKKDRRAFYEARRAAYGYVRRGFCRVADIYNGRDCFPEALHGPRPSREVIVVFVNVIELQNTTL